MPNGTYGGVRGRKMTVGGKQPTSFSSYSIYLWEDKEVKEDKGDKDSRYYELRR